MTTTLELSRGRIAAEPAGRLAGLALFVLAAQFMTVIMLAASMAPNYDLTNGAISDLGVVTETSLMFNASLIAVGLLNLTAGWLLYRSHRRAWILAVFALAGLGAVGAGLFPLNRGDLHGIFALVAFVFFNLEAIAVSTVVTGPMRWLSIVAAALGLAFVVIMVIGDSGNAAVFGPIGHGGAERMIVYPPMLWLMTFGGYLMATRADPVIGGSAQ